MSVIQNFLIASVASIGLAGFATSATAGGEPHVMTVTLPGGAIEQIHYSGDVAPQIVVDPGFVTDAAVWSDPFAAFARISAEMDHEMGGLLREAQAMSAGAFMGPGVTEAALGQLPPGAEGYSFVSTVSGDGVCGRSVQITSEGPGRKPHVVSKSFGNCGAANGAAATVERPDAVRPAKTPGVVEVKSTRPTNPYAGMVQEAAWH